MALNAAAKVFGITELAEEIFGYLNSKDLINCCCVCRRFDDVLTNTANTTSQESLFMIPCAKDVAIADATAEMCNPFGGCTIVGGNGDINSRKAEERDAWNYFIHPVLAEIVRANALFSYRSGYAWISVNHEHLLENIASDSRWGPTLIFQPIPSEIVIHYSIRRGEFKELDWAQYFMSELGDNSFTAGALRNLVNTIVTTTKKQWGDGVTPGISMKVFHIGDGEGTFRKVAELGRKISKLALR